ncbi:MAG: DUF1631 family protein [Porticoccaceae bacterium]|nr:DUF1631 family protein [Porticoccaceae bacterium]
MSKGIVKEKKQLVQSLGQLCQQHLSDAFKKFNEVCSSSLVGLAARAESNRLQTLYLDSQRLLRKQRSAIEAATIAAVFDHFSLLDNPLPASQSDQALVADKSSQADSLAPESDSLKLLGHEDLEVMIALDNCSSRVREELRAELHQLEARLKSLLENMAPIQTLPMSPDAILEAFVAAIDEDMIALEVQLELVRIFDQACFDKHYAEMLGVANQMLEDAGFSPAVEAAGDEEVSKEVSNEVNKEANKEPDKKTSEPVLGDKALDHKPSTLSAQPDNTAEDAQATSGIDEVKEAVAHYADEPSPMANTRIQTELLAKISSMLENAERESAQVESLSAQKTSTADSSVQDSAESSQSQEQHSNSKHSSSKHSNTKPCMDKPQLLAEINKHMNDLITNRTELLSNGQITKELAAAIKHLGEGEDGSRLHRNDQSVFQVVENIFSSFGQSMKVAPEVQQVINRCELPMLKLAINKPLILEQENHPIRRLFNEMAKYAIGLEQGDCEDNQIYQQMLKLSESMAGESFDEQKLPAMLSEFMAIVDRDRRKTSTAETRELEQIAAQEKVNWARTRVEEEITRRIVGKKLSEIVVDFIQHSWCMVMHMAHLRSGEAGTDWLVAIKLLENLVHLARRSPTEADTKYRHELLAHIDARLGHNSTDLAQRALQVKQLSEALGIAEASAVQSAVVTEIAPSFSKRRASKNKASNKRLAKGKQSTATADTGGKLGEQQMVEEIKRILVSAVKAELPGKNISQAVRDAETLDSSAQRILMALQKGCWIELGSDIKAHKRGKLAGIVGPSWKYVFVDNKGKLIAERDRARLALDLMDGKVTVLDNSHLFDKAIKQAITQIKGLPVAS